MKFSIIVPVYNVEKYLEKCLDSILNQTYKNFELIIVNDGSTDTSEKIICEYEKRDKRIHSFNKKNGGLSDARNFGLSNISGDYILFVDSDDYIGKELLERLNKTLNNYAVDLVRFSCTTVDETGKNIVIEHNIEYENKRPGEVIVELVRRLFVEPACLYCYKSSFWRENGFLYNKGMIHEDYGLTPVIIYYSSSITSINYNGYFYVQRFGSITKTNNYEKLKKGVYDMYNQYQNILRLLEGEKSNFLKKVLFTYLTECVLIKGRQLKDKDLDNYLNLLRHDKVLKNFYVYNLKKLVKKSLAMFNLKLYINLLGD